MVCEERHSDAIVMAIPSFPGSWRAWLRTQQPVSSMSCRTTFPSQALRLHQEQVRFHCRAFERNPVVPETARCHLAPLGEWASGRRQVLAGLTDPRPGGESI